MTLLHAAIAATLLGLVPAPALADIAAPRNTKEPQAPIERRTGRVPATITVLPAGAATAPTHLVITVPREVLREVMSAPPTAGQVGDAGSVAPGTDDPRPAFPFRHIVGAVALALAVAALPLAFRRRGRAVAVVVVLLAAAAGVAVVKADRRLEHPPEEPAAAPALASWVGASQAVGGPPRTVEFVIVPGRGPVRVEARYVR